MSLRLSEISHGKRKFNSKSKKDRDLAFTFLKKNSWSGITDGNLCPFHCEWPYLNVPAMLKDKLLEYYSTR